MTGLAAVIAVIALASSAASGRSVARTGPTAHAAHSTGCGDPYPHGRNARNPLLVKPAPKNGNPLSGAHFFVDGPAHGSAAGVIARLIGIDSNVPIGHYLPYFSDSESWARFKQRVTRSLPHHRAVAGKIRLLEKIANGPEANRFSFASEGGTPSGLADFARKLYCHNFTADPHTVPIITTDFLHGTLGGCPTTSQINAYMPRFHQQINAIANGTGRRPVVFLLETDAIGSSQCINRIGAMGAWEAALRYEATRLQSLPHTVVYLEAGYSDANRPGYTARILNGAGVRRIRGFFTNDTHKNWTINEIKWGNKISALTHGAHFIVNTADNGNGPLLNKHPSTEGIEDLCNPPGRGLGPQPTTATGYKHVDAFLWTHVPGVSSGRCNGGPASGTFWPAQAEGEARRANNRLGPQFPSKPY